MIVPVVFILLLPVAFAASVKRDDHADNAFTFAYDAEKDEIVAAASSTRHSLDDDVSFFVTVAERNSATAPLAGKVRLALASDEAIRYEGTMTFTVESFAGDPVFQDDRTVSFTLRPKKGKKAEAFSFPFDVPSGDYSVTVSFSR